MDEQRLWLIRHAPVAGRRGLVHAPEAPADTSDTAAFAALRAALPSDAAAYASPARRTQDTARALGLTPILDADFREQRFGAWTGRQHNDLERELGPVYKEFWRAPAHNRPPGGESFCDQIERVRGALARLPAGDVVLVVHSGTVRATLATALDLAAENALRFVIAPLSLTRVDRLAGGWRIVMVSQRFD